MSGVVVLDTGTANIASVLAALQRVGATPRPSRSAEDIERAAHLLFPGVAALGAVMEALGEMRAVAPLKARIAEGRSTLCICVGLQALAEGSEESPGVAGLGVVPGVARRFEGVPRVPHLGWNEVLASPHAAVVQESGDAYFANSYRLLDPPEGWVCARTDYGGPFIAAMERGAVVACQFHPELSGPWGQRVLARWLERGAP